MFRFGRNNASPPISGPFLSLETHQQKQVLIEIDQKIGSLKSSIKELQLKIEKLKDYAKMALKASRYSRAKEIAKKIQSCISEIDKKKTMISKLTKAKTLLQNSIDGREMKRNMEESTLIMREADKVIENMTEKPEDTENPEEKLTEEEIEKIQEQFRKMEEEESKEQMDDTDENMSINNPCHYVIRSMDGFFERNNSLVSSTSRSHRSLSSKFDLFLGEL